MALSLDNLRCDANSKLSEYMIQHIEEFACAFAKHTNLPPDKIVMFYTIEWRDDSFVNKIWFEQKKEDGYYG